MESQIILGDCLEKLDAIKSECIDLVITSPPYNLGNTHHTENFRHKEYDDDMPEAEYQAWQANVLNECYRVLKPNGSMFYNHKNRIKKGVQITPYEWIFRTHFYVKQELVWFNGSPNFDKIRFYPMTERVYWLVKDKNTKLINTINHNDVFTREDWKPEGTKGIFKRAFPVKMVDDLIACFPEAEVILDPFAGSGTVAVSAMKANKKFICIEKDPEHYDIMNKRLDEITCYRQTHQEAFYGK